MNTRVEHIMGLPISIDVRDEDPALVEAIEGAFESLREADSRFSPFRTDSEICRYDRGELAPELVSDDFREVMGICSHYERESGGAFTARVPGRGLDPSAVVKGWAVQRAADFLRLSGAQRFCVNAGGDVIAAGEPEDGRPWRVGVRHPDQPDTLCAVIAARDLAVATSATYERGQHIFDGRTGEPAGGLVSVTITASDLTTADSTATAAFAMGRDGIAWAAAQPGCEVLIVDADRRVHRTPGLHTL
ncbi:MAG: thiamine biosynthesis protein [Amycolatopsis sp.]|uniref:FAD:protein FMN transferase n=1 Tax=Amycolatopsis sp. TaxID=37632 RepID=UPI0026129B5F|nr:FAD:protein FMN transferase [Amycolatopsis sp.]MCU1686476.1 thiamine biosynthesis protein [Amycolatopsis sp.]